MISNAHLYSVNTLNQGARRFPLTRKEYLALQDTTERKYFLKGRGLDNIKGKILNH